MRVTWLAALFAGAQVVAASEGVSQTSRLPVSYSPNAVAGVKLYGDAILGPTPIAWGARVAANLAYLTVGFGHAAGRDTRPIWHASLALNPLRGPQERLALSVDGQYWSGRIRSLGVEYKAHDIPLGVGISPRVRQTGLGLEPWLGARAHIRRAELADASETNVGYGVSAGANLDLNFLEAVWRPLRDLGVHAAGDYLSMPRAFADGSVSTLTVTTGISYTFRLGALPQHGIIRGCDRSDPDCVLGEE